MRARRFHAPSSLTRRLLPVLVCGLLASAGSGAATAVSAAGEKAADVDAARARELVHLVRQDCGSCHGLTLKGGLGKPLLPADLAGRDAETLAEIILEGIPETPMPPWRGQLTEAEALWIARRLKEGFPHETP